jgi:hypothetical protein
LLDNLEKIRQAAKRGPLHRTQFQIVKLLAKKCSRVGLKKSKRFADIVKDTPRQESEPCGVWVRRIWDECEKYDTKYPEELTEELLERYSRRNAKNRAENLPQILPPDAKSFRSGNGNTGNSAKAEGRRAYASL